MRFDVPVHDPHAVTVIQGLADTRTYIRHVRNHGHSINNITDSSRPGVRVPRSRGSAATLAQETGIFSSYAARDEVTSWQQDCIDLVCCCSHRSWNHVPCTVFEEHDAERRPTWWQAQCSNLGSPVLPRSRSLPQKGMILTCIEFYGLPVQLSTCVPKHMLQSHPCPAHLSQTCTYKRQVTARGRAMLLKA